MRTAAQLIGALGLVMLAVAIWHERRMQRHRQPGVSYSDATIRRDGGWNRNDLFTDEGLKHQRQASGWGFPGLALIIIGLIAYAFF